MEKNTGLRSCATKSIPSGIRATAVIILFKSRIPACGKARPFPSPVLSTDSLSIIEERIFTPSGILFSFSITSTNAEMTSYLVLASSDGIIVLMLKYLSNSIYCPFFIGISLSQIFVDNYKYYYTLYHSISN
jgi:hypothetical protein